MIKYVNYDVVFEEVPDEVTLAINISNCPHRCKGCHSAYLAKDIGDPLTNEVLDKLISANDGITCVSFMGGDANPLGIVSFARYIKENYPQLKVAWYSGNETLIEGIEKVIYYFDYVKLGPYDFEKGPLNKPTTNQVMYQNPNMKFSKFPDDWINITYKFWK